MLEILEILESGWAKGMEIMSHLTSGYTRLPVIAAGGLTGPVLVAAGGLVVVLAILLVFVMVLRSNGDARRTSNGIGYDSHQGPYGQSRAPVSQPGRQRQAPPWSDDYAGQRDPASRPNGGQPSTGDWPPYGNQNAPASANGTRGGGAGTWGSPSGANWGGDRPASSPQWGGQMDNPNQAQQWGGQPAAQAPAMQNAWDQPQRNDRGDWGQQGQQQGQQDPQGWNAPPTTPRGWDQPAQQGNQNWGAPAQQPAQQPAWGAPAPAQPAYGGQEYGSQEYGSQEYGSQGFGDDQRTYVAPRPAGGVGEARLVVSEGKEVGRSYDLRKDRITIGRSRESDIFLEDLAVSRTHTTINRQPNGQYLLRDENSANGTVVNGQRVSEHMLAEGDKIQVGQTLLVFVTR
jgi:Inner membrane component of T3SS, cytoplasmic domain